MSWVFDKMDLADIYRRFYLITDYKSISNTHGTFSRVDQTSHKTTLLKCIWLQQYLVSFQTSTAWNYNSISERILENYVTIKPHACEQTMKGWKEKPKEIREQVELQEGSYLNKCLHWYWVPTSAQIKASILEEAPEDTDCSKGRWNISSCWEAAYETGNNDSKAPRSP